MWLNRMYKPPGAKHTLGWPTVAVDESAWDLLRADAWKVMSMDEQVMADVWSQLPTALVDLLLSHVSVPEFCRFRTVCPRWNSTLCTPEFGDLCAENGNKDHRSIMGQCFLRKIRDSLVSREIVGWSILDLNDRRWYTWKDEQHKHPLATDGGFVLWSNYVEMTIFNPISRSSQVLPDPPCSDFNNSIIAKLIVDSVSCTFKVFLIHRREKPEVCMFESATNQWRNSSAMPLTRTNVRLKAGVGVQAHSVVFQGLLYISTTTVHIDDNLSLQEHSPIKYWLFSYNFLEDSWADTHVDFPKCSGNVKKDLVVSGARLFLMSGDTLFPEASQGCLRMKEPLSVTEIELADGSLETVSLLSNPVFDAQELEANRRSFDFNHAYGFDNSMMLTYRGLGFSIMYELVTGFWELRPPDQTVPVFGNAMPLRQPCAVLGKPVAGGLVHCTPFQYSTLLEKTLYIDHRCQIHSQILEDYIW
uniref:F-box domain-containing protein n=2 Tax=Physcomitrium patens TaxID=3218 RepID=A0A2K1KBY8_PHYPA|nr:hypothetical protein PHYPA_010467 [Physcomitrium patens]